MRVGERTKRLSERVNGVCNEKAVESLVFIKVWSILDNCWDAVCQKSLTAKQSK